MTDTPIEEKKEENFPFNLIDLPYRNLSKDGKVVFGVATMVLSGLGVKWCIDNGFMPGRPLSDPNGISDSPLIMFVILGLAVASASTFAHIYDRNQRC